MADHRLEDPARLANLSPFHFHRVYASVAGETVAATVRRVRLALVAQVGLTVGCGSPEAAFTRVWCGAVFAVAWSVF